MLWLPFGLSRAVGVAMDVSKLQEKKAALEDELQRTERQIYDLEGEYLQVRPQEGCHSH